MNTNKKEIWLFEAFSGLGSQYKALKNISKELNWEIKLGGVLNDLFQRLLLMNQSITFLIK